MRVLVDPQIFSHQTQGGISRYVAELINGFRRSERINVFCPLMFSNNTYAIKINRYLQILNLFNNYLPLNSRIWNRILNNIYLRYFRVEVFIPSFYDIYFMRHLKKVKLVITIHDMIHEKFPDFIAYSEKIVANKKALIYRADLIIAVSFNTKKDILDVYPDIDHDKIKVIYSGNSLSKQLKFQNTPGDNLLNEYFLFVGLRKSYKNYDWMINALAPILKRYRMRLLCIGGGIFSSDEVDNLNKLDLNGLVTQKNVDDSGLIGFYQNALALIMPSQYEGFGFPIVEAMSNKCPVILNKNSCFPEIAGIAGCFYEADNIDQFQYAVESVLTDRSYRANLVKLGLENAKKFTWENCVNETSKAILSLKKG